MLTIRQLGIQFYETIWEQMKSFTSSRDDHTPDELWLLEHFAVYTQGQAGKAEHLLNPGSIPVVQSDRGGQITYHGPGQLIAYVLMDISRRKLGIRTLVSQLEHVLITVLSHYHIKGITRCEAPGVYVGTEKIASIGLRVKNGCTYHGIALNVNMDLSPFTQINPCGFAKLKMTQISEFISGISLAEIRERFTKTFLNQFEHG